MSDDTLKHLGHKSILTPQQIESPRTILDAFPNPSPGRDYEIKFVFPEFTSMCPVTGQPDFATISVIYTPAEKCVEMKSLKLYYLAFRNKGVFYERVANQVMDDLIAVLKPERMTVIADFNARGGTVGVITCRYPDA